MAVTIDTLLLAVVLGSPVMDESVNWPPVSDLKRFPPRTVCAQWLANIDKEMCQVPGCDICLSTDNEESRWMIKATILSPREAFDVQCHLMWLTRCRRCWDKLDDCWARVENPPEYAFDRSFPQHSHEWFIRRDLHLLRITLGADLYYRGYMPLP